MNGSYQAQTPSVGILWLVSPRSGSRRLLTAGCALNTAESYGDFLTFPDGHYAIWEQWRRSIKTDAELRSVVRMWFGVQF